MPEPGLDLTNPGWPALPIIVLSVLARSLGCQTDVFPHFAAAAIAAASAAAIAAAIVAAIASAIAAAIAVAIEAAIAAAIAAAIVAAGAGGKSQLPGKFIPSLRASK